MIPPAKKGENKKAAHRPRIAHSCAGDDCFVHFLSFPASFPAMGFENSRGMPGAARSRMWPWPAVSYARDNGRIACRQTT